MSGRDDECGAAAGDGGELVAEGFPAPVGMTSRTSRPSVAARQTASWLARKAGWPKVWWSRVSRFMRLD